MRTLTHLFPKWVSPEDAQRALSSSLVPGREDWFCYLNLFLLFFPPQIKIIAYFGSVLYFDSVCGHVFQEPPVLNQQKNL